MNMIEEKRAELFSVLDRKYQDLVTILQDNTITNTEYQLVASAKRELTGTVDRIIEFNRAIEEFF